MQLLIDGDIERLSEQQLSNMIESQDVSVYLNNQNYFEGKNTTIIAETKNSEKDPNNQIPLPFGRKTVKDTVGYSAKPGKIQYIFEPDQDERSMEYYREVEKRSDLWITTTEEYQDGLVKGQGAELAWVDEDGIARYSQVDREQCIFEYTGLVTDELFFAIRYYRTRDFDVSGDVIYTWHAFVYWNDRIDEYTGQDPQSNQTKFDPQENQRTQNGVVNITGLNWKFIDSRPHLIGRVPLYPMPMNSDNFGVFQASIPIIDRLDKFGSDSIANEIDSFKSAILTLSKKVDKDNADKIKDTKIIDDLGTEGDFVKYVKRESDIQSSVESFRLFEEQYYKLTGVPDISDDRFGTESGIAIAYKLIPFENLVSEFEAYFSKGLRYRMSITNHLMSLQGMQPLEFEIKWERNLPFDLANRVSMVVELKKVGILSDETLLKMFPEDIIKDADKEIERRDAEKMDQAKKGISQMKAFTEEPQDTTEGDE